MKSDDSTNISIVGLRKLSEEDIEFISEELYDLVRKFIGKRIQNRNIDTYDISIDIDNSQDDLRIEIDISLNLPPRLSLDEEKIINDTLEETLAEVDKLLKEKFSN
ncbi:MAG: DUF3194 domain-containing protein [Candidatus Heimdallarchaeota archaeon]